MLTHTGTRPAAAAGRAMEFNWPMAFRTSTAALCLLGFGSRAGADWMAAAAVALMLYTIAVPAPVWRFARWSHLWSIAARLPHVAAFGAAIILAGLLADAPVPLLADLGSLAFIIVLLVGALAVGILVLRAVAAVARAVPSAASRTAHTARFYGSLAWLAVSA